VIGISQPNSHNHFTGKKRFQTPKRKKKKKQDKTHVNKYEKFNLIREEVRKMGREITIKNGETETTINEQAISVSAPKIEIKSSQESGKSNHQS